MNTTTITQERRGNDRRGEMRRGECRRMGARRNEDANDDFLLPDVDQPFRNEQSVEKPLTVRVTTYHVVLVVAAALAFTALGFFIGQYAK